MRPIISHCRHEITAPLTCPVSEHLTQAQIEGWVARVEELLIDPRATSPLQVRAALLRLGMPDASPAAAQVLEALGAR